MRSLPVGDTILRAWGFAGRRVLPLLGVGWLAAAFYGLVVAFFLTRLSGAVLVWPRPDAGSFNNFAMFYLFCLAVATAFANAAMAVPMTREALEPGGEWKSAYFVISGREWALFANLLLLYVIVIGVVSAIAFAGSVGIAVSLPMIGNGGVWQDISVAPLMLGAVIFVAVAAGLFLATRFGFFLAPIAVADSPARLLEAWSLSSGKFFRLLAIGLLLVLPVIVLALLIEWAAIGSQFADALGALLALPHDTIPLFQTIRDHSGATAAILAGALLVLNAIFAGASAEAYATAEHGAAPARAVREHEFIPQPALAMAAAPTALHLTPEEAQRFEPTFPRAESAARPTEAASAETAAVVPEAAPPETEHVATAMEESVRAEAAIASPEAMEHEAAPATALPEEEPLAAHQDALPEMEPLSHAGPAEPDPTGEPPATPLPSFVKAQPSPEHEPSEAA